MKCAEYGGPVRGSKIFGDPCSADAKGKFNCHNKYFATVRVSKCYAVHEKWVEHRTTPCQCY
jgi:hypothetical protein